MNTGTKVVLGFAVAIILVSVAFIGGFATARVLPSGSPLAVAEPAEGVGDQVDEVQRILEEQALEPPSETSATAGAIQGLLESNGDKYANYFDQQHFKYFNEDSAGEFGGIGVVLGQAEEDGSAYVVEVYDKTPAKRAGVLAGDKFKTIDGVTRSKWEVDEVVKRVRGEAGTDVKIVFSRPAEKKGDKPTDRSVTITRAMIEVPNVMVKRYGDVGYIRMMQFNQKSAEELTAQIEALDKKGATSYILDLRHNPGGLLSESIDVASLFIKSGVVVRVEERNAAPVEYRATGETVTGKPLVLLINGESASASEIVAGALQDYGRAELVGVKTFGKGSVQTIEQLGDGSAIKFTIAHYLTPKKREINGKGVTPDIVVKMEPKDMRDAKTDKQLQKAIEVANDLAK